MRGWKKGKKKKEKGDEKNGEEKRKGMMWPIMFDSILVCLNQTWCDPSRWWDLFIVKNSKDSKIFKIPKRSSKLQGGCHLRKDSKFKREIDT